MAVVLRKTEIRVGLITLLALVLLVAGIMWGKGTGIGVDRREIVIEFDNAAGVSGGTVVYLYGVRIGTITNVSIQGKGAEVVAHIDRDVTLYDDAYATIQVMELTGGKKIELFPGSQGDVLTGRARLPGRNQADIGAIIAVAQELATNVEPLLLRADSLLADLSAVIGDENFQRNVTTAADQFAEISVQLNGILRENRGRISTTLIAVEELSTDLQQFVARNEGGVEDLLLSTGRLVDNASQTLEDSRGVVARVDLLIRRLDSLAVDLREGDGTVSRFIYDKSFALQLDSAMMGIRRFLDNIDRRGVNVNVGVGHKK